MCKLQRSSLQTSVMGHCQPQGLWQAWGLAHANLVKFKEAKCKGLHIDWGNPMHNYKTGGEWIKMQALLRRIWGCWWLKNWEWASSVHLHTRKAITTSPLCSVLQTSTLTVMSSSGHPDARKAWAAPEVPIKMIRGLEDLSYEEAPKLGELGLFSLRKRNLQANLTVIQGKYYRKDGKRHFISKCTDRIECNSFQLI